LANVTHEQNGTASRPSMLRITAFVSVIDDVVADVLE
jgi:hypothetical protein